MRTRVCITIDTEFSIGGAFADASRTPVGEPMVWCEVGGRSEGLGFMLGQFQRHQVPATFFVEALQRQYFTHDPMAPIARRIAGEGHEVQLHAHPCWSVFGYQDWQQRVQAQPRQDDFYGRAEDDSVALIQRGQAAFADWGVAAPTVFRSGSLQHDATLYRALARCGIPYSSNVGVAIFDSGAPEFQLYSGVHERAGVLECPVLTFQDWRLAGRRHLKTLTIAGTSFEETRTLLEQAYSEQVPLVVLLTHPFEYVQRSDDGGKVRRHAVNQARLAQLCAWLDAERARFEPSGLGAAAAALASHPAAQRNVLLQGRPWQSLRRMATQVAYDRYGGWQLARQRSAAA